MPRILVRWRLKVNFFIIQSLNSSNSNLPPSSDRPFSTKPPKQQKKKSEKDSSGKKKANHPDTSQKLQKPTQELDCPLTVCPHCGGSTFTNQRQHTHQHFGLRPNPIEITHCHIHTGKCACCGRAVSGEIPRDFGDHMVLGLRRLLPILIVGPVLHGVNSRKFSKMPWASPSVRELYKTLLTG